MYEYQLVKITVNNPRWRGTYGTLLEWCHDDLYRVLAEDGDTILALTSDEFITLAPLTRNPIPEAEICPACKCYRLQNRYGCACKKRDDNWCRVTRAQLTLVRIEGYQRKGD